MIVSGPKKYVFLLFCLIVAVYVVFSLIPKSQGQLDNELVKAVGECDVKKVQKLLKSGANPNTTFETSTNSFTQVQAKLDVAIGAAEMLLKNAKGVPKDQLLPEQQRLIDLGATIEKYDRIRNLINDARKKH